MTAWRYLVEEAGAAVASAEVGVDAKGAVRGLDHVNEGPFVKATAAAQKAAAKLPQVRDGKVEARVIRVPALYVMALWLKDSTATTTSSSRWRPPRRSSRRTGRTPSASS